MTFHRRRAYLPVSAPSFTNSAQTMTFTQDYFKDAADALGKWPHDGTKQRRTHSDHAGTYIAALIAAWSHLEAAAESEGSWNSPSIGACDQTVGSVLVRLTGIADDVRLARAANDADDGRLLEEIDGKQRRSLEDIAKDLVLEMGSYDDYLDEQEAAAPRALLMAWT